MNNELLPIGSVVIMKNGQKEVMIVGYYPKAEGSEIYDYAACLYPEGILSIDQLALLKRENIDKVLFYGYMTPKTKDLLNRVDQIAQFEREKNKFEVNE